MARAKSGRSGSPEGEGKAAGRKGGAGYAVGAIVVLVVGLMWFMQREANDLELEREMRSVPGGEVWMTACDAWVKEGARREGRAIWVGKVDELVRTDPEIGAPVLLAVKLADARRIAGEGERKVDQLYVGARGFGFLERRLDEPLTGHRWMVATYENEHGQRQLFDALPAPGENLPPGEVMK